MRDSLDRTISLANRNFKSNLNKGESYRHMAHGSVADFSSKHGCPQPDDRPMQFRKTMLRGPCPESREVETFRALRFMLFLLGRLLRYCSVDG